MYYIILRIYYIILRICYIILRMCYIILRMCYIILRMCYIILRIYYIILRMCYIILRTSPAKQGVADSRSAQSADPSRRLWELENRTNSDAKAGGNATECGARRRQRILASQLVS